MRTLIKLLLLGTVAVAATGCVVVPLDDYHHGGYRHGGYYEGGYDRHCR